MNIGLTRKEFLSSAAIGVYAILMPPAFDHATETHVSVDLDGYIPEIPQSENQEINLKNKKVIELWGASVEKAMCQNFVVTCNPQVEPSNGNYRATVCSKEVTLLDIPCNLLFSAIYSVSGNGNAISEIYKIDSYAAISGSQVRYVDGWLTTINNGTTITAIYTTSVTWTPGIFPAHTEVIATYVEFYADGHYWLC